MSADEADAAIDATQPFLISFSGIDGAGKTTQIEQLSSYLEERDFRVLRLSFWDDVAVWSRVRAGVGQRAADLYLEEQAAEYPFSPKNHKHIRNWYLTAARSGLYVFDVVRLRSLLASPIVRDFDVVIFDRYIYDQIANVYSGSLAARVYSRALLWQAPTPDLPFILDTSPDAAFARKPEYPLEFMCENRENFLNLRELAPELITIPNGPLEQVKAWIRYYIDESILTTNGHTEKTEAAHESAVVLGQNSCRVQNEPTTST